MSKTADSGLLISHLTLRKLLGFLGVLLPIILVGGVWILNELSGKREDVFQPSISHYYYTVMGDVFVAVVAAFGLFLFTYKGYDSEKILKRDNLFTNSAGVCALLVAFFPTLEDHEGVCLQSVRCVIHLGAAALFFAILAYISLFLFTESNVAKADRSEEKNERNVVYLICGIIMVVCLLTLTVYFLWIENGRRDHTVLIFESLALLAFGISWLTKGEVILPDPE